MIGLDHTLLIMLLPLTVAGLTLLLIARRTYPRDVATAVASESESAVGGLVLAEDFGVPVPGETILVAAAVYAGTGRLNIIAVAIIAFVGAVIGDNIGYSIGHFGGRRLVLRFRHRQ